MPYPPPTRFLRTEAQKRDQTLSWARDDQAFFAAGACHILAYAFHESHPEGEMVELVTITDLTIHEYCQRYEMRPPEAYAHLSWDRAHAYLRTFPETPPVSQEKPTRG